MKRLFVLLFLLGFGSFLIADELVHHDVVVEVSPGKHILMVTDTIKFPENSKNDVSFLLHTGMDIVCLTENVDFKKNENKIDYKKYGFSSKPNGLKVEEFFVNLKGKTKIKIEYSGEIFHPVTQSASEYARSFSETPGTIEEQGIYLSKSSFYLPYFSDNLVTFSMTSKFINGFDSISIGKRTVHEINDKLTITKWECNFPTDDIYLIGGKFVEYETIEGKVKIQAFLRKKDDNLANKYLETTGQYLKMYEKLIGKYPYSKFALVENFWETGYGMPSFTLLGPQVIRFPFILHSSYPHELLHNWWGNSVYVDYSKGNWCEGLTAYLADHLIKEQRGQGKEYRRSTLQKFTDFVNNDNDFPLSKFKNRFNGSSEAIGYGKSLMMFNMLRENIGDDGFKRGLKDFYKTNKFKKASFDDVCKSFEKVTNKNLKPFFNQWINRLGAPKLQLTDVFTNFNNKEYKLNFKIKQTQIDSAFSLNIPVFITFDNKKQIKKVLLMDKKIAEFSFQFKQKPTIISVDPQFNLMRILDKFEVPPTLTKVIGSKKISIIIPENEKSQKYKNLAEIWARDKSKNIDIITDGEINKLPDNGCWIFGENNKFAKDVLINSSKFNVTYDNNKFSINKKGFPIVNNCVVITSENPENENATLNLLTIGNDLAVNGLSRKLLHYGKYSYLVFEGNEPTNIFKGIYDAVNSPLIYKIGKNAKEIDLQKRAALENLAPVFSIKKMKESLKYLASNDLEGRGFGSKGLEKAAAFIANKFKEYKLKPFFNGSYVQIFEAKSKTSKVAKLKNVIGVIEGKDSKLKNEFVIISAHYDHLGIGSKENGLELGKIYNGADDNSSGVSVLMELARVLGTTLNPKRTVIFIAFSGEEHGLLGSKYFVKNNKYCDVNKINGMLNLDTVGRLEKNKVFVLGGNSSSYWKHIFMGIGFVTGIQSVMVKEDLDSSDQIPFIEKGIPAIQLFSGPNLDYHKPTDTSDKIDFKGMVKIATVSKEVIEYLSNEEKRMPFSLKLKGKKHPKTKSNGKKRASTGVIPDFAFQGEGVRLSGTVPNSPVFKANLKKNDVIKEVNGEKVTGLREYSIILKKHKPGEKVKLKVKRENETFEIEIVLAER